MSSKIISLVQPNFQQGPKEFNAHYLPYSVGVLWSYVQQFPKIRDNITLDQLIWNRTDVRINVDLLKKSDIIAFSTYVWNKNYNYALAKQLKENNPACIIIFGETKYYFENTQLDGWVLGRPTKKGGVI